MSARAPVKIRRSCLRATLWPLLAIHLLALAGCANFQFPRIDPTGERIFAHPGDPSAGSAPGRPGAANWGISVSPSQVVAPVGSEVVMIASLCGPEGFMLTGERVEWLLAPDGAGAFLSAGDHRTFERLHWLRDAPQKIDNRYVVNSTLLAPATLDRGTSTPTDDILVQSGQSWVSVTSPTEGTSHVTVFGPRVSGWDRRQQTASIYWIDAQWRFPAPAITPVGSRHTLTTLVSRQSNGTPLAGWQVHYEIAGGPEAGFAPDGAPSVDVLSNEAGEASVEIFQKGGAAGTNQINIQITRPAAQSGQTRSLPIGSGATQQTWTSGDLAVRASGPAQTTVGATITYRFDVTNPGGTAASDVVLADQVPPGLEFVNSNPASDSVAGHQEWRLGELPPRGTATVEANYRISQPGSFNLCATVTSANGTTTRDCVTTSTVGAPATPAPPTTPPAAPAVLEVTVNGPTSAAVGSDARFEIQVINRASAPARQLVVTDRFDAGLEHAVSGSSIEKSLGDLPPGAAVRFAVTFRVAQSGELCQEITVEGEGGAQASTRHCLTAANATPAEPGAGPPDQPPGQQNASASLRVTRAGTDRRKVGETALVSIELTNTSEGTLTDVVIANNFDASLEPAQATQGQTWMGNALGWKVDSLAAGKSVRREIVFKCTSETLRACDRVTANARGIDELSEEICLEVVAEQPEDQPAPGTGAGGADSMKVSVAETSDPVKVGSETTYQVLIENQSQQSQFDVGLAVTFTTEVRLENLSGPVQGAIAPTGVKFAPLRELRAGETATFELRMKALREGTARFKAEVTARGLAKPVADEQTTEVLP